jgi:hypothetical protein
MAGTFGLASKAPQLALDLALVGVEALGVAMAGG